MMRPEGGFPHENKTSKSKTQTPVLFEGVEKKTTPEFSYRRDCEPVGLILITIFRDAVYGFMPPLGRWALMVP
jgi:hypothetical protein